MGRPVALIVGDNPGQYAAVGESVEASGCTAAYASTGAAEPVGQRHSPDLVLVVTGAAHPAAELACLASLRHALPGARCMFLASISSEELAIAALNCGAERYVKAPWSAASLQADIAGLLPAAHACGASPAELKLGHRLVGRSVAMQELRAELARIAPSESTILITGETGTGKELVAELIHHNSRRADRSMVCMNMAALPETLVESELFGHERGAFTGATTARDGKLAAANGGTVFLDEVGDTSLTVQAKLLRAIENRTICRVGGTRPVLLDVRFIAATNQDLEHAANEGRFRSDLYYRLNVLRVRLPPLRERVQDIPLLVNHYVRELNRTTGRSIRGLSPRAIETLSALPWRGNVRELRNVIEALLVHLAPETTGIVDIPAEVMRRLTVAVGAPTSERERLLRALTETKWNKTEAATKLHCSRMTLYRKMHEHEIELRR